MGKQVAQCGNNLISFLPRHLIKPIERPVHRANHGANSGYGIAGPDLFRLDAGCNQIDKALEESPIFCLQCSPVLGFQRRDLKRCRIKIALAIE